MNDRRKYISEEEEDRICLECDWVKCRVGKEGCGLLTAYLRIRDAVAAGSPASAPVARPARAAASKAAGACLLPNCTGLAEEGGLCAPCRTAAEACGITVAAPGAPAPPPASGRVADLEASLQSARRIHQELIEERDQALDLATKIRIERETLRRDLAAAVRAEGEGVALRFTGASAAIIRKLIEVCGTAGTDPAQEFAQLLDDLESGRMYLVQRKPGKKLRSVA